MQIIAAVAECERDLLIERTQSGIARAKATGKQFGRPPTLNKEERAKIIKKLAMGISVSELAREFKTTRRTVMRVRAYYAFYSDDKTFKSSPNSF